LSRLAAAAAARSNGCDKKFPKSLESNVNRALPRAGRFNNIPRIPTAASTSNAHGSSTMNSMFRHVSDRGDDHAVPVISTRRTSPRAIAASIGASITTRTLPYDFNTNGVFSAASATLEMATAGSNTGGTGNPKKDDDDARDDDETRRRARRARATRGQTRGDDVGAPFVARARHRERR
tara:strand:+ start:2409 stop:2945 length:537 start_codon:yes stop_codon:yes gene_type:complete